MAKYRILYLSSQFPTRLNPHIGVFSVERVRALTRADCEVVVIAPVLMTPPPGLATKPIQVYRWLMEQVRLPERACMHGIDVYYPKWFCPPKTIFGWCISEFLLWQIRRMALRVAREFGAQVILSSWLPDAVAALKLGEKLDIPTISIADGTDVNEWPKKYPGWKYARDVLNEKSAALIFVSEALRTAGSLSGLHARREVVIHNAVDVNVFKPSLDDRKDGVYSILAVGRLVRLKGFHVLLEAFAECARRMERPARLILVGDGPEREALRQKVADLGILSSVEFAGAVDPDKIVTYYQEADLLCLSSFSEGLPCVVVEAMACGKPVVASNVGGVAEVIDAQSGILVPPGDPRILCEALLQAVCRVWDAEAIRRKIIIGFDWGQWTTKVFQLIGSIDAVHQI